MSFVPTQLAAQYDDDDCQRKMCTMQDSEIFTGRIKCEHQNVISYYLRGKKDNRWTIRINKKGL